MKLTKREAIRLCNGCSKLMQEACVFADIERAKDGQIEIPACLKKRDREERAKTQTHLGSFFEDEELEQPLARKRKQKKPITNNQPQMSLSVKFDKTDLKILKLIKEGCYRNEILRNTNRPATTVRGRLDKLIRNNIIRKNPESIGFKRLGYVIMNRWADALVTQEIGVPEQARPTPETIQPKPEPVKFTKHACSFKSEILAGIIPKGDRSYTPNNWTGEIFYGEKYDIRVIPNKSGIGMAVIDVKVSLGAGTEEDLNTKYFELAVKGLGEWSHRYNLTISRPEFYRAPHTPIEGSSGLADAILGSRSEVYLKDLGVQVDKSDKEKKGEVEFVKPKNVPIGEHKKKIQNFEYMLNQSPQDIKTLAHNVDELKKDVSQSVNDVKKELNDVQQWLVLQRENDLLREQNQLLKTQLNEMSKQIEEMRAAVGLSLPPKRDEDRLSKKYDYIGYA